MASFIRRKIAQRVYEICKFDSPSPDHIARQIKFNDKFRSNTNPFEMLLKTPQVETNGLIDSFKGDEHINSVTFDDEENQLLFSVNPLILAEKVIKNIITNEEFWKTNCCFPIEKPEKIIVEFSSPNIAKPFHAGHLRSTVIGNFVARINQAMGHNVITLNYLGDWGTQFALLNVGYKLMGSPEELARDPIGHLYKVYVSVNDLCENSNVFEKAKAYFQKLENNDEKAIKKWNQFRDLSLDHLRETYERLGVHFTEYHGESMYRQSEIGDLLQQLKDMGLLITLDGAQVVETSYNRNKNYIVLVKQDGTTLYLSRDIAAAINRFEKYDFDQMYYVVENGQTEHFNALFHILKRMQKPWHERLHHIKFGRINGMSTRKGKVVFLKDILEEAKMRLLEAMEKSPNTKVRGSWEEVADVLGSSAVVINSMKFNRMREYEFDWNKILTTQGPTSGIRLQYCHARLCSLRENCGFELQNDFDVKLLEEPEAMSLIHCLSRYDEALEAAYNNLEPQHIVQYLFQLCNVTNFVLKKLKVKNEEKSTAEARLALFTASQRVLNHGLNVIGVRPLNKM